MHRYTISTILLVLVLALAVPSVGHSVMPSERATMIFVDDMHCGKCAKKIARKLYTVPGVVTVYADVENNVAMIEPQESNDPSPRALWEAVQYGGGETRIWTEITQRHT